MIWRTKSGTSLTSSSLINDDDDRTHTQARHPSEKTNPLASRMQKNLLSKHFSRTQETPHTKIETTTTTTTSNKKKTPEPITAIHSIRNIRDSRLCADKRGFSFLLALWTRKHAQDAVRWQWFYITAHNSRCRAHAAEGAEEGVATHAIDAIRLAGFVI